MQNEPATPRVIASLESRAQRETLADLFQLLCTLPPADLERLYKRLDSYLAKGGRKADAT